jgi:UDP-N-acetylmuramoylalanine-D-glutamate ligase
VILSPACSSFDRYRNFEEREAFHKAVKELRDEHQQGTRT